eukprot:207690_1
MFNYDNIRTRILFLSLVSFLFAFTEVLPSTPIQLILTQDLDITPATQKWFYIATTAAYLFQPLFAIIVKILSLHTCCKRRFFAVIGVFIGGAMYLIIGYTKPNFKYLFIFTIIENIGFAFCSAIIDGISVEISNYFKQKNAIQLHANQKNNLLSNYTETQYSKEYSIQNSIHDQHSDEQSQQNICRKYFHFGSAASIQSLTYFFGRFGGLASSAMMIGLHNIGNYSVLKLTGILYIVAVLPFVAIFVPKSAVNIRNIKHNNQLKTIKTYWNIIKKIWRALLFIFLLNIPPNFSLAAFTFIYSRTYFTTEQFRVFQFMGLFGAVLGSLIYFTFLAKYCENKTYFTWIFVLGQTLNFVYALSFLPLSNLKNAFQNDHTLHGVYGIPFGYYISVCVLMDAMISTLQFLPQMTLAAQMSPLKSETYVFALFMGVSQISLIISGVISTVLLQWLNIKESHWDNLSVYTIICGVSGFLPLCVFFVLKRHCDPLKNHNVIIENENVVKGRLSRMSEACNLSITPTTFNLALD